MNRLSQVFVFKITATVFIWCLPLLLFPEWLLEQLGFPPQSTYLFVRLLAWAYLALCVGYGFGLLASLKGVRSMPPIWVGIVSNGGACILLLYFTLIGAWSSWSLPVVYVGWSSIAATALITVGLVRYGIRDRGR